MNLLFYILKINNNLNQTSIKDIFIRTVRGDHLPTMKTYYNEGFENVLGLNSSKFKIIIASGKFISSGGINFAFNIWRYFMKNKKIKSIPIKK